MTQQVTRSRTRAGWLAGVAAGVAVALGVVSVDFTPAAHSAPFSQSSPNVTSGSFADVFEQVSPAVVNIIVTQTESQPTGGRSGFNAPQGEGRGDPQDQLEQFFGRFFDMPQQQVPQQQMPQRRVQGQGSGFVIDPSGYIVTNNHVVDHSTKIVVTMNDGRKLDATLVGHDPKTDLALIKVNGKNMTYVEFADSDSARVGDWVMAIGNPFGLGGTATAGIVSARGRHIENGPYDDYFQIDAPINFGNSGGPLFNQSGKVIGINTAIYSPNGGNIGIGFAIPSNQAKNVIKQLRENGSVQRGWLGVQIQDLDEELATSVGLKDGKGALVADVVKDSPAAHAGLQAGDVITRFNDHEIDSARALSLAVADVNPSSSAKVSVWRDGKSREMSVKLGEAKAEEVASNGPANGDASESLGLGLQLRGLTDQDRSRLGVPSDVNGALVVAVEPDSPAADKGLEPGDLITRVNQKPVTSASGAVAALKAAKKDKSNALLLVRRGDSQRFVALSFS
jgi:serine protease Do